MGESIGPKGILSHTTTNRLAATKTQERRKDTDDSELSHNDTSVISRRNSNKSHQEEKQKKGERMATGEDPLPFSLYRQLCVWMLEDDGAEVIFGHAFIAITWNLVCHFKILSASTATTSLGTRML